jgi:hypothetical protein
VGKVREETGLDYRVVVDPLDLSGSRASDAQKDATEAQQQAVAQQADIARENIDFLREQGDIARERLDPFVEFGDPFMEAVPILARTGGVPYQSISSLLPQDEQYEFLQSNPLFRNVLNSPGLTEDVTGQALDLLPKAQQYREGAQALLPESDAIRSSTQDLLTPQGQYDYLSSNPLFGAAVENSNREIRAANAAQGKSGGGVIDQLFKNYLATGESFINNQFGRLSNADALIGDQFNQHCRSCRTDYSRANQDHRTD